MAVLLVYEHALVRPDDLTRVNLAFFQVNVVISIGLLAFGVADLVVLIGTLGRPVVGRHRRLMIPSIRTKISESDVDS